jgi:hypothetical protein
MDHQRSGRDRAPVESGGRRVPWRDTLLPWAIGTLLVGAIIVAVLALPVPHSPVFCAGCSPYSLGLENLGSSNPAHGLYYVDLDVFPSSGLTTGIFGLRLTNSTTGPLELGDAPASCAPPSGSDYTAFTASNCGAPTGIWYAVLVYTNGTVANVFSGTGAWVGAAVSLANYMHIDVVSAANYTQSGDLLDAYGTSEWSVSGQVFL